LITRENGYEDDCGGEVSSSSPSQPPTAVNKPSRPPRSVANNFMPQNATHSNSTTMPVGSPFPVATPTDFD